MTSSAPPAERTPHPARRALALALALGLTACDGGDASPGATHGAGAARPAARDTAGTAPAGAPSGARGWFADVTAAAGIDFVHDAGVTEERHLPETMGAGGVLADLDGDGDLDVYLVQGGPLRAPPSERPPNRLYLNDGTGRFTDATDRSGAAADRGYGMGAVAGDVDGDADLDLFVTNLGPDVLLLNDGAARFTAAAQPALADPRWTTAATLFDADGDADLDLYVTGYVLVDLDDPVWCGRREPGYRSYCHPDTYPGLPDRFYRNDGGGRFTEATAAAGLVTPDAPGKGLGALASDLDDDGDLDLYVANDSVENRLWLNRGDGTFEDGTLVSGTGVNGRGMTEAGMGLATGDVDGDLDLDLFVTNFDDESNTLYRNDGGALFTDATVLAGLEAASRPPVGFGTVLADLDGDGDLDLAVTNGHIIHNVHLYDDGKRHAQRAQLFVNDGSGRFTEVTAQAGALSAEPLVGRGLYSGDVDGDGDLDLLLTQCGGRALLLRNDGPPAGASSAGETGATSGAGAARHGLRLTGLPPGTRVLATTRGGRRLLREAANQVSYLGGCAPDVHLAPGAGETVATLEITVPGRPPQRFELAAGQAHGTLRFADGPDGLRLS